MSTSQTLRPGVNTHTPKPAADLDLGFVDQHLREEMLRLAAVNKELLGKVAAASQEQVAIPEQVAKLQEVDELAILRAENSELRARLEDIEQVLASSSATEEEWAERQKNYEALLEEKSEVIRSLHLKMQHLQENGPDAASATLQSGNAPHLKQELEEQRRQLEQDEEALMQQMRQMEMAMSKDRAELARQRHELQRMHNELNREIEMAGRDPGLRERLLALQRRTMAPSSATTSAPETAPPPKKAAATPVSAKKQSSGLLHRLFGK